MKQKNFLLALLLIVAGMQTLQAQTLKVWQNGKFDSYDVSTVDSVQFVEPSYEWVDLDLPSGTLWATCNVGANSPEEYGDYFAWGETTPKESYTPENYQFYSYDTSTDDCWVTKYCQESDDGYNGFTDNLTELLPEHDAATANWGSEWQMPSLDQIKELLNSSYTTTTWTTQNGVNGYKISANNGNSIFLPAAGIYGNRGLALVGSNGDYWSRSLDKSFDAYYLNFYSSHVGWTSNNRCWGQPVRPVRKQ